MKTPFHNKIVLALLCLLFFNGKTLRAQIICTDVNPDLTVSGNATLNIDVNNDLVDDFRLTSAVSGILGFVLVQGSQIGTNNFVLTNGSGASTLALNAPIGPLSTTWTQMNGTNQIMMTVVSGSGSGNWSGANDLYLGLQFIVGLNTYFGWARFSFSSTTNAYTFKDYAYNSVAGQSILAGQGCGSITNPYFSMPATLCVGGQATLTANTGTAVPTSYNWIAPGATVAAFSASNAPVTTVSFSASGTYTVLLVVVSGTALGIMQNTVTVGFTPTLTSNAPVCSGQALTFSTSGASTYTVAGPAAFLSTVANPTIVNPSVAGTGVYTLFATSALGCTTSVTNSITIKPLPTTTLTPLNSVICAGIGTVALYALTTGTSVTWSPATGLSGTSGTMVIANPVVPTTYTVTSSLAGCSSSAAVTVDVQTAPLITANGVSVCPNQTVALSATLSPGSPINSYTWTGPGNFASQQQNPIINGIPPNAGVYTVNAQNNIFGCVVMSTLSVFVHPSLFLIIAPSSPTLCLNSTTINLSVAAFVGQVTWSASPGPMTATGTIVSVSPAVTTTYTASGFLNTCPVNGTTTVTVLPALSLAITGATVCTGQPAVLSAGGANTYLWTGPGGFMTGSSNASIAASPVAGTTIYTVTGTASTTCQKTETVALKVITCTGINAFDPLKVFSFYPNPVKDLLFIESGQSTKAEIEIYDALGKIVLKEQRNFEATVGQSVDLGLLSKGIYILKINLPDGKEQVSRIIK